MALSAKWLAFIQGVPGYFNFDLNESTRGFINNRPNGSKAKSTIMAYCHSNRLRICGSNIKPLSKIKMFIPSVSHTLCKQLPETKSAKKISKFQVISEVWNKEDRMKKAFHVITIEYAHINKNPPDSNLQTALNAQFKLGMSLAPDQDAILQEPKATTRP